MPEENRMHLISSSELYEAQNDFENCIGAMDALARLIGSMDADEKYQALSVAMIIRNQMNSIDREFFDEKLKEGEKKNG